ncbi:hypothetical protein QO207_12395 [Pseudomonas sp. CAN2814]|uniref:hypothetical protein n=1 Tax=Pseudomonas sp. CAN1 TaxID=3046726 RepID=UPI00264966F5|nr:hypothetical protein [Pseudomonas sp. CAN1]MDN6857386.1 hypothetical protein [Pseudomonas sp. CAN1]
MRYALVSTVGYLLLVDLQSRSIRALEHERPEYYGISWFAGSSDLLLSHSGLDNATLLDLATYAQSEVGWISLAGRALSPCLSAPHQILCAPDGRVICTNTGRNVITVLDPAQPTHFQQAGISSARWDRLSLEQPLGDHLNSLFLHDGQLHVLAHRHRKGSALAVFSYPQLELSAVETLGARSGLHNIWITDQGQRISCHSEIGGLVDLDARAPLWQSGSSMYSRGLAACEDYVIVGESLKSERAERRSSLSGLWILDRHTWQAIDYLSLGPYGAVHEVRLLDVPDQAHHREPFAGLAALLEQESLGERLRAGHLRAAQAVHTMQQRWGEFEVLLGIAQPGADGARRAASDDLNLVLKSGAADLAFDYVLQPDAGQSHVGVVLDYRGSGGDTYMTTLLLHPRDAQRAVLTLWRQDGSQWQAADAPLHDALPLAGTLHAQLRDATLSLWLDGHPILQQPLEALDLPANAGPLGIRWLGCSVTPAEVPHA